MPQAKLAAGRNFNNPPAFISAPELGFMKSNDRLVFQLLHLGIDLARLDRYHYVYEH